MKRNILKLGIVCKVGQGVYKKHFIVNYIPEMIQPFTITSND